MCALLTSPLLHSVTKQKSNESNLSHQQTAGSDKPDGEEHAKTTRVTDFQMFLNLDCQLGVSQPLQIENC